VFANGDVFDFVQVGFARLLFLIVSAHCDWGRKFLGCEHLLRGCRGFHLMSHIPVEAGSSHKLM
jgi:hypothetical protein